MKQFIENKKNVYSRPEIELIVLSDNDVVITSGGGDGIVLPAESRCSGRVSHCLRNGGAATRA